MKLSYEISGWEKNTNSQLEHMNYGPAHIFFFWPILRDLPPSSAESARKNEKFRQASAQYQIFFLASTA